MGLHLNSRKEDGKRDERNRDELVRRIVRLNSRTSTPLELQYSLPRPYGVVSERVYTGITVMGVGRSPVIPRKRALDDALGPNSAFEFSSVFFGTDLLEGGLALARR